MHSGSGGIYDKIAIVPMNVAPEKKLYADPDIPVADITAGISLPQTRLPRVRCMRITAIPGIPAAQVSGFSSA